MSNAQLTHWTANINNWKDAANKARDEMAAAGINFNRLEDLRPSSLAAAMAETQLSEEDCDEVYAALFDAHDALHEAYAALQDALSKLTQGSTSP